MLLVRQARSTYPQLLRRQLLVRERDRELDSAWVAYARDHPDDSAAKVAARRRQAVRPGAARHDSLNAMLRARGVVDTSYSPRANSQRALLLRLGAGAFLLAVVVSALLIPVALVVLTVVWGVHRARRPATGMAA